MKLNIRRALNLIELKLNIVKTTT